MTPTVITLAPNVQITEVSFEDAFGEHSNFKGRGRERRAERKIDRAQKRTEVAAARQGGKAERKMGRQEMKQQVESAKQERKASKQQTRIGRKSTNKAMRQEGRLSRKMTKAQGRADIREIRRPTPVPVEPEMELESTLPEDGGGVGVDNQTYVEPQAPDSVAQEEQATEGGYTPGNIPGEWGSENSQMDPQSIPGNIPGEWGSENVPMEDSGQEDSGGEYVEESTENGEYVEGDGGDAYNSDSYGADGKVTSSGAIVVQNQSGDYYDEDNFDTQEDSEFSDDSSEFSTGANPNGKAMVSKNIADIANRAEWNREALSRLQKRKLIAERAGESTSNIDGEIDEKTTRLLELEGYLSSFCGADGKFDRRRAAEVRAAKRNAKNNRMAIRGRQKDKKNRIQRLKRSTKTNVAGELNPVIKQNYIEIPPADTSSNFDSLPYEGPADDMVYYNAGGPDKKVNWGAIAIGVVLAGGFIYVANKYKWFDKLISK